MVCSRTGQLLAYQGTDPQRPRLRQVLPHVVIEQTAEDVAAVLAEHTVRLQRLAQLLDDQAREDRLESLSRRLDILGAVSKGRRIGQAGHGQQWRGEDVVHGILRVLLGG